MSWSSPGPAAHRSGFYPQIEGIPRALSTISASTSRSHRDNAGSLRPLPANEQAAQRRVHVRVAGRDERDRAVEVRERRLLEDESKGTRVERLEHERALRLARVQQHGGA